MAIRIVLCLLGWLMSSAMAQVRDSEVVLGQSAALTGPAALVGQELRDGALAYFNTVNARGGIHGRKITLVTLDDAYDPAKAIKNTVELIDKHNAFAMFGFVGASVATSTQALVTQGGIPFFAPYSGAQLHRDPVNRWTFNVRAGAYDEIEAIVQHLMALSVTRIAVFHENDAYGQSGLVGVQQAMKRRMLTPVAVGTAERNSTEVKAAVEAVRKAQPAAVILLCSYAPCAAFTREMLAAGAAPLFFNLSSVGARPLVAALGLNARGINISQVVPFPWDDSVPLVRDYQRAIKDMKLEPSFTSLEGYIAARVFTEALQRAGRNLTRDGLVAALEGMTRLDIGGYVIQYGAEDHGGSRFVELTLYTKDGRFRR